MSYNGLREWCIHSYEPRIKRVIGIYYVERGLGYFLLGSFVHYLLWMCIKFIFRVEPGNFPLFTLCYLAFFIGIYEYLQFSEIFNRISIIIHDFICREVAQYDRENKHVKFSS